MKIFNYELTLASAKKKQEPQKEKATPIYKYPVQQQAQGFSRYVTPQGDTMLSYETIDQMYEKTIMNRVINKIAGDATRMNYELACVDKYGYEIEPITDMLRFIDIKVTRKVLRNIHRDSLKYGTAFVYVQYGPDGLPITMFNVHPKFIKPIIENGVLTGWKYSGVGNEIILSVPEILYFPDDPQTGEVYGKSIFGAIVQMLELLINSQLNIATLLDRFALPILVWFLDSQIDAQKTPPDEIIEFMEFLIAQLDAGNDVGVDSSVKPELLGTSDSLIDFVPVVEHLLYTFGAQVGVPMQLLGLRGDNLSVSRMQAAQYSDLVKDKQENVGDALLEQLYKPYLERNGIFQLEDYDELYLIFPLRAIEENSDAIKWIVPAQQNGYISRRMATNSLGFKGYPIPIDRIEVPLVTPEVARPGARKPSDPSDDPEPPNPDEDNRDHDTGDG